MIELAYEIQIGPRAKKALARLSRVGRRELTERLLQGLEALSEDPFRPRPGADILRLKDVYPTMYRLRVGDYRVIYEIDVDGRSIHISGILHRKHAYTK